MTDFYVVIAQQLRANPSLEGLGFAAKHEFLKKTTSAGTEVKIKHSGGGVLLLPSKLTYEQVMTAVGGFKGTIERRQPVPQKRKWQ